MYGEKSPFDEIIGKTKLSRVGTDVAKGEI
jgi:hypothetical protein